jgi:hypothetical protein
VLRQQMFIEISKIYWQVCSSAVCTRKRLKLDEDIEELIVLLFKSTKALG